ICGVWKNLPQSHVRQLQAEQLRTFSSTLTSEEEHSGMGGIAMLTLSDTENNLHFVLILQGLMQHRERDSPLVPILVRLHYRQHVLREIRANVTAYDADFAEVLTDLNSRELFWLSRGQLVIAVETEGQDPRHISGFITGRKSCDTIQSVMSSGDALTAGKTGGVGSAFFNLHDNGTLDYQRSVLYDLTPEFDRPSGRAAGSWSRLEARHIHMLLQNELFINIPVPLAGQFVAPPVLTSAGGHAWVSVDERCHLHYEIVVAGLSKADDLTVHVPNNCEFGTRGEVEVAEFDDLFVRDPEELKKDPHTCFFESQHHAHGSLWTPNYNNCFTCSCQRKNPKDMKAPERLDEHPEGCYFEGDQKMHAPGSTWHPFVPPFGYIKCALCTCKGATGEVHCEKVTCPALTCSRPVRRSPSDCCKECLEEDNPPLEHTDMMQADGTSHCKFGKNFYQNSDNWHPRVPLMGEMKCITCWCDVSITWNSKEEEEELMKVPEKKNSWRH
ncbi:unnamed protein product, partial [Coregonus sp. 'balchen']